jgi:hypothetical protein
MRIMSTNGMVLLERFQKGGKLSRKEAMLAKCADCMGGYGDGRRDCEVPGCPMYAYMPYCQNRKQGSESA